MLKKIYFLTIVSIFTFSNLISLQYDIQDIGTLQTKKSEPIAINAKGQILGSYVVDGVMKGKYYFLRNRDGKFNQLPVKDYCTGREINWLYLNDNGQVFGTFNVSNYAVLYMWDKPNGLVNLGNLPTQEIMAINNSAQVLIKSIVEVENGRSITRPAIWQYGVLKSLRGLESEIGIESQASYGFDMNNKGEVVGKSISHSCHKNEVHDQIHAVKWVDGEVIDLHHLVPKNWITEATMINDLDDVIVCNSLIRSDGKRVNAFNFPAVKKSNRKYFINADGQTILDRDLACFNPINIFFYANTQLLKDYNSVWLSFDRIIGINDAGEIIALGTTMYNETHAILLVPVK